MKLSGMCVCVLVRVDGYLRVRGRLCLLLIFMLVRDATVNNSCLMAGKDTSLCASVRTRLCVCVCVCLYVCVCVYMCVSE